MSRKPTPAQTTPGERVANPDLVVVHKTLVELVVKLDASIGEARTAAEVVAILDEIAEVNARVTTVGRQLFTQQTEAITKLSGQIETAATDVQEAVDKLESIKKLVQTTTAFLKVVDKVVDTAKLIA